MLLLFCSYLYLKIQEKPLLHINKERTELSISSNKLLSAFKKVIIVKGNIKKITYLNNRYTVLLQGENEFSHIICDMSISDFENVKKLKTGESVDIKGVCKGYLMDVVMLNCIIANE